MTKVRKRSVIVAGHKTSVSLEEPFWEELAAIAAARESRGKDHRFDVLAIQCLLKAEEAGFTKWRELAKKEKGLSKLRASELWKRVNE